MNGQRSISDHEFGGTLTDLKLSIVEAYLRGFTTALSGKNFKLWYIDAFAGTGERTVRLEGRPATLLDTKMDERIERRRGSAQIAIDTAPAFDRLVFMDKKKRHVTALNALKAAHPERDITVVRGDANRAIQSEIDWSGWSRTRAVMFLDPYGMAVEWATLEAIQKTRAIDL